MLQAATGAAATLCVDLAVAADGGHSAPDSTSNTDTFIEKERRAILDTMAQDKVEGVVVCLIRDGKPAWVEGFGVTDGIAGRAVDTATIFSIQSTSKNFTAAAIMLAVQRGLLDLDDTWLRFPVGERYRYSNLGVERMWGGVCCYAGIPVPIRSSPPEGY
jgi:CubicO group peptidase (beta-lactamase class C family)